MFFYFYFRFEIVITFTGSSTLTGQMTQSRTSFLPREIVWGQRFVNMIKYDRQNHVYNADYDKFDITEKVRLIC